MFRSAKLKSLSTLPLLLTCSATMAASGSDELITHSSQNSQMPTKLQLQLIDTRAKVFNNAELRKISEYIGTKYRLVTRANSTEIARELRDLARRNTTNRHEFYENEKRKNARVKKNTTVDLITFDMKIKKELNVLSEAQRNAIKTKILEYSVEWQMPLLDFVSESFKGCWTAWKPITPILAQIPSMARIVGEQVELRQATKQAIEHARVEEALKQKTANDEAMKIYYASLDFGQNEDDYSSELDARFDAENEAVDCPGNDIDPEWVQAAVDISVTSTTNASATIVVSTVGSDKPPVKGWLW
ncbi:MAG: hypothetical protein V4482_05555 [Pseudomonadota bacterium]